MPARRWFISLVLALCCAGAHAGSACISHEIGPDQLRAASQLTLTVIAELEAADRPLAIVSRVGQDLSQYGQRYSHAGLVVRDHPAGRWTVIHELNHCGSADSGIYAEGMLNVFLDDMVRYEAHLLWPDDRLTEALLRALADEAPRRLHNPEYSVISRYGSESTQNSTAWLAELIGYSMAAEFPGCRRSPSQPRQIARCALDRQGFTPDSIRISYGKRVMGGLFSANASFVDHPLRSRLSGNYEVVTVRSILDWLRPQSIAEREIVEAHVRG